MQTLLYGLIYGKQETQESEQKIEEFEQDLDYETVNNPIQNLEINISKTTPESQTIQQIYRRIKCLNEFKEYIERANSDKNTIYYRYIVNTTIHENDQVIYTILPGVFIRKLYPYLTSQDPDDFIRTLAFMEL